ncbi:tyrosine-protein phosphatase non-receptor type 20-like protein [Gorgonomyces haynaldii]|nr:tyrosine-protein phosphatase non-receptor type 20-like protein [Gorgonomyces haynaldii]
MAFQHQDLTRNHAQQSPHLNRYTDILPYDHNRVKLGEDGYINASYLTCLDEKIKWIATQGPLPNTVCDFWQMVWEQQSSVIVMLTQEEERGRIKSHRYWPPLGDEALYEKQDIEFLVRNLDETTNEQIIKRVFQITYNGEQRTVTHIHFLGWPDHQVADPHQVLKVLDLAKEAQTTGHMIVHCSAGCGRTAAFCTIDAVLHLLKTGPELSPHPDWDRLPPKDLIAWQVDHFRRDRIGSVQTAHQFIFCYDAVLTRLGQWFQDGVECTWYEKETRRFSWRIK